MSQPAVREAVRLLADDEGRANPYPLYETLRKHPPVLDAEHYQGYLITRYEDCRRVLSSREFGRPGVDWFDQRFPNWRQHPAMVCTSRMMQFGTPRAHQRLRGAVSGFFTARRVAQLAAREATALDGLVEELAAEIDERGEADLQSSLSYRLPSITISAMFGIPPSEAQHFFEFVQAVGKAIEPRMSVDELRQADAAYEQLRRYFDELVAARRRFPQDDLATHIVRCQDQDPPVLSSEELVPMFVSLYAAGTMNTTSFIGNGVVALLRNHAQSARLLADPSLDTAAVDEVLRFEAPMQIARRMALAATDIGGTRIPAGAQLGVVLGSANRDPEAYTAPDRFDIARRGPAPLSFGGGAFYCIGAALARLEGALVFRRLLTRLPGLRLTRPPTPNLRSVLRGYLHVPVSVDRHA